MNNIKLLGKTRKGFLLTAGFLLLMLPLLLVVLQQEQELRQHASQEQTFFARTQSTTTFQTQSGNLRSFVQNIVNTELPARDSNIFTEPTTAEVADFTTILKHLEREKYQEAQTLAVKYNYSVIKFTDTGSQNATYGIIKENLPYTHGWGIYIVRPGTSIRNVVVEAPHPKFDIHSANVGSDLFRQLGAAKFFVAGTHLYANRYTKADNSSDTAHNPKSMLHLLSVNFTTSNDWIIQPHGFGSAVGNPDIIISGGIAPAPAHILQLDQALAAQGLNSLYYNGETSELGATTNVQGQDIRSKGGKFVHLEMALAIRQSNAQYNKIITSLASIIPINPVPSIFPQPSTVQPTVMPSPKDVVPTYVCGGSQTSICVTPTPSTAPSAAPTHAVAISPAPTEDPCNQTTAIAHTDKKSKHKSHHGGISEFIQQLLNFFTELMNLLLKLIGNQNPNTNPTPQPSPSAGPEITEDPEEPSNAYEEPTIDPCEPTGAPSEEPEPSETEPEISDPIEPTDIVPSLVSVAPSNVVIPSSSVVPSVATQPSQTTSPNEVSPTGDPCATETSIAHSKKKSKHKHHGHGALRKFMRLLFEFFINLLKKMIGQTPGNPAPVPSPIPSLSAPTIGEEPILTEEPEPTVDPCISPVQEEPTAEPAEPTVIIVAPSLTTVPQITIAPTVFFNLQRSR